MKTNIWSKTVTVKRGWLKKKSGLKKISLLLVAGVALQVKR